MKLLVTYLPKNYKEYNRQSFDALGNLHMTYRESSSEMACFLTDMKHFITC